MKHTPPPYTMRDLGHGVEVRGPDGESIGWFGSSTSVSRDKAITVPHVENAKLFVSAPELRRQRDELLTALKRLAKMHRRHYGLDGAWDEEIQAAEAAIKKVGAK